MPNSRLLALASILAVLAAGAARAEPLGGGEIQARAAGGEFRGDTRTLRGFESHIWQFAPGGAARAIAVAKRGENALSSSSIEFGDEGRWRVEGNTLCVDWPGANRRFSGCYAVNAQQGSHVRLIGPARWEGTLER